MTPRSHTTTPRRARIRATARPRTVTLDAAPPVTGFVRSPAGTRTIAFLADTSWPASGATVTIDAVQTASALYDLPAKRVTVTTVPLGGHAPWEDDDG